VTDPEAPHGARVPLRITLVALLVALVTAALVATGVAATSLLRGYLLEQQDAQLERAAQDVRHNPGPVLQACTEGVRQPFPAPTYVGCLPGDEDDDVVVVQGPQGDGDVLPDLSRWPGHDEGIRDGDTRTVRAEDGSTSWRVTAVALPDESTAVLGINLDRDQEVIGRLVRIEVVVGLVVLALLGAAGYVLVSNSLRPLAAVERTAQAIAGGDLSRRVPPGDPRTEVGRLSTALNGMLARIESAFRAQQSSEEQARASEQRMRRFVADASHELRTPLTSIRGFAELYRQGAASSPEDVRRLLERIEDESARMGLLVEDLLLLARLDQQRPLDLAPVDLAQLAGDAVHDARAVQPERPIALHLDESLTDAPVVRGDEARLRQVIGNLVTNALAHTATGTRVTVSLAEDADTPGMVVLRVVDEGPGMAPEVADRVFERFYRAEASRTREAGGSGLGLAIVASLVTAHGGTVDLDTAPGRGAAFIVRLPRSGPTQPPSPDGVPATPDE
jgi:two-component system OmpR family sensor kinase